MRCAEGGQWSTTCSSRADKGTLRRLARSTAPTARPDLQAWHTALTLRYAAPQTPEKRAEGDEECGARLEAEGAARADAARRRVELLRQRLQEQQRREQVGSLRGEVLFSSGKRTASVPAK